MSGKLDGPATSPDELSANCHRTQFMTDYERWDTLDSKTLYRDRWIEFRVEKCQTSQGAIVDAFHIIDYPLWVNAVVITDAWEVVLLREYRHGVRRQMLGIPSGYVESTDEGPHAAMVRELREETGYEAPYWHEVSRVYANASNQTNEVVTYLALDARKSASVARDATESISVSLVQVQEFLTSLRSYVFQMQALHVAAVLASLAWICEDDDTVRERVGLAVERRLQDPRRGGRLAGRLGCSAGQGSRGSGR